MTTPNLRPTVPGCYRCDLREDEARDHQVVEWDDQITDALDDK